MSRVKRRNEDRAVEGGEGALLGFFFFVEASFYSSPLSVARYCECERLQAKTLQDPAAKIDALEFFRWIGGRRGAGEWGIAKPSKALTGKCARSCRM